MWEICLSGSVGFLLPISQSLSLGFLLEDFNVYLDYLFDEFSHPCIVSDHFLYFGQLVSTHVNDPCFLLAIFIG